MLASLLWLIGSFFQLIFINRFIQSQNPKTTAKDFIKAIFEFFATLFLLAIFIYGAECGLNPPIENECRILRIPANGVLMIKSDFEGGKINDEYYFIDKDNKRTKITKYQNSLDRASVTKGSSGIVRDIRPNGGSSSELTSAIHYSSFQVYQNAINRSQFKEETPINSLSIVLY